MQADKKYKRFFAGMLTSKCRQKKSSGHRLANSIKNAENINGFKSMDQPIKRKKMILSGFTCWRKVNRKARKIGFNQRKRLSKRDETP